MVPSSASLAPVRLPMTTPKNALRKMRRSASDQHDWVVPVPPLAGGRYRAQGGPPQPRGAKPPEVADAIRARVAASCVARPRDFDVVTDDAEALDNMNLEQARAPVRKLRAFKPKTPRPKPHIGIGAIVPRTTAPMRRRTRHYGFCRLYGRWLAMRTP
jgi:hypothetical protein